MDPGPGTLSNRLAHPLLPQNQLEPVVICISHRVARRRCFLILNGGADGNRDEELQHLFAIGQYLTVRLPSPSFRALPLSVPEIQLITSLARCTKTLKMGLQSVSAILYTCSHPLPSFSLNHKSAVNPLYRTCYNTPFAIIVLNHDRPPLSPILYLLSMSVVLIYHRLCVQNIYCDWLFIKMLHMLCERQSWHHTSIADLVEVVMENDSSVVTIRAMLLVCSFGCIRARYLFQVVPSFLNTEEHNVKCLGHKDAMEFRGPVITVLIFQPQLTFKGRSSFHHTQPSVISLATASTLRARRDRLL